MEGFSIADVWRGKFAELFSAFILSHAHEWSLAPTLQAPAPNSGWCEFLDDAKIRFDCYVSRHDCITPSVSWNVLPHRTAEMAGHR